jgi:hypothetical protein
MTRKTTTTTEPKNTTNKEVSALMTTMGQKTFEEMRALLDEAKKEVARLKNESRIELVNLNVQIPKEISLLLDAETKRNKMKKAAVVREIFAKHYKVENTTTTDTEETTTTEQK